MSRFGQESPMDFEFQNGTGPIDGRSPFAQISQNSQRFPPSATKKSTSRDDTVMQDAPKLNRPTTGSYNAFDSPSKSRTNHPSSPSKPLPAPPTAAFNSLFSTPRKANNDIDDSSAGETPRSPEQRDDSDATPDRMNFRNALPKFNTSVAPAAPVVEKRSPERSPVKEEKRERPDAGRRDSWIVRAKNKFYSPGRGEVPRADHSHAMEKRVEKRRRREVDRNFARRRRHSMSDTGDDDDEHHHRPSHSSPRKTSSQHQHHPEAAAADKPHWLASMFTFIAQHPTVPHILSFYAQLAFNLFLLGGCAYLIYCFWSAVQGDVDKKSHEAMADIMAEMAVCAQQYTANKCDASTRVPAMETVCENWAKCMNRNPEHVGRAKVSAHTFAEIFNSFVEPISYKAMAFALIIIFGSFAISNFAFGFFRNKAVDAGYPQQPPGPSYFQPPPTPQRSFSGQDGNGFYGGPGTPWHHHQQQAVGFEPQPSGGYGQIEGKGSPVRRIAYN